MKALVVDDSAVMRKIMISALQDSDVTEVGEAADGAEAVKAVSNEEYAFVLMDWNMPNMLGIEALKAIRDLGNQVPIIMVTTESEKSRVLEALKAGANNYVVKPFKPQDLIDKVQKVLGNA